jgi:hypothetical protein
LFSEGINFSVAAGVLLGATALVCTRRFASVSRIGQITITGIAFTTGALVGSELGDHTVRRFWQQRPLTAGLVVGLLTIAATVLLVDEIVARRDRRRWRSVALHALTELREVAVSARIGIGNALHEDARTRPAMEEARAALWAREAAGPVEEFAYEHEVQFRALPIVRTLRDDEGWRSDLYVRVERYLRLVEGGLARWAVVAIGDETLTQPTDAVTAVARRLQQLEWCLRTIEIARANGWASFDHDRYRIAYDGLPELVFRVHRESLVAMQACDAVLTQHHGMPRLMDDQIAKDLGLPGNEDLRQARSSAGKVARRR